MNERRRKFPPLFDDELALPDLAQWAAFYGGYDLIPAWNGITSTSGVARCGNSTRGT